MSLEDIKARAEAASAGPWDNYPSDIFPLYIVGVPTQDDHYADVIAQMDEDHSMLHEFHEADVDFICAARTDVPKLVAALESVLRRCDEWQAAWDEDRVGSGNVVASDFRSAITDALGD